MLLGVLGLTISAVVPAACASGGTAKGSDVAHTELSDLQQRAEAVSAKLKSSDPAVAQGAQAEWKTLLADFEAWAKKHNRKLETRTRAARAPGGVPTGGPGRPMGHCEPVQKDGNLWCVLKSEGTGSDGKPVCTYECSVDLPKGSKPTTLPR